MPRLGVLGTMVWDRIHARDVRAVPFEEWGGIGYALAAFSAARPAGWELVPLIKIGQDLQEEALRFLRGIPRLELTSAVRVVPAVNSRVELRYHDGGRRFERLTGGVPPWSWSELAPAVGDLDALYVNFISGFELSLESALKLRLAFRRPIYADIHSLLLGIGPDGQRVPRPLAHWRDWLSCFDIVQLNEDELGMLAQAWGDPWRFAADVVDDRLRALLITLGARGAAYVAGPSFRRAPTSWYKEGICFERPLAVPGPVRTEMVPLDSESREGDPTGCGDVWGATCFARLLAGDGLEAAMMAANRAAARNVEHRGASGLHHFLEQRIQA